MIEIFQAFFTKMKDRFSRLARSTRNEKEVSDLHNDAFVIALDIGDKRGYAVDLTDPADQDLVMRELYLENVKRGDWKMRYAVRIDEEPDRDETGIALAERLPAPEASDPLVSLLLKESADIGDMLLTTSYSQASAYVVTFRNFRQDLQRVCFHLALSESGLSRRLSFAQKVVHVQPSVFDRLELIPHDFVPRAGRRYDVKEQDAREAKQCAWDFDPA